MWWALTIALLLAAPIPVRAAPCDDEAAKLRAFLEREGTRMRRWNTAWAIGFGAATAGQIALAATETKPFGTFDQDFEETLYVGAAKSGLGFATRLILPLRVEVPPRTADACADLDALRGALAHAARREKRGFWLGHLGGLAINVAGVAILGYRRSIGVGAASVAISYPFSLAHTYTQPRRAWHRHREGTFAVAVSPTSVSLLGEF